jgi:hypothetical protein
VFDRVTNLDGVPDGYRAMNGPRGDQGHDRVLKGSAREGETLWAFQGRCKDDELSKINVQGARLDEGLLSMSED